MTDSAPITLPRNLVLKLMAHAQSQPQQEVCGLIGAQNSDPLSLYRVANVAADAQTQFEMEPQQQINAIKAMRERGEQLFAIYHSHPASPPVPSLADLQGSAYPEALYLIISLNTKGVLEVGGWRLVDGQAEAVALQI